MRLDFHRLPDPEVLDGMDDLKAAIEEHHRTLAEWRACNVEYEQLRGSLDDSRAADEEAAVEAYRAGKKDPGKKREQKVLKQIEEVQERQRVREGALRAIEREISGAAQRARERIPAIEKAIEKDNKELISLLEKVHEIQVRRAGRRGLIHWLRELPGSFAAIEHTSGGMTEEMAWRVLMGSTQPPASLEDPNEGTVRLVG